MAGKTTHGAIIWLDDVEFACTTSITPPSITRSMIDDTAHCSTTAKSKIPEDLYELGDCTVVMDYIAGSPEDDACLDAVTRTAGNPIAVRIQVKAATGAEEVSFNAYGTSYSVGALTAGTTDKQTATLVLTPTGAETQAPGGS